MWTNGLRVHSFIHLTQMHVSKLTNMYKNLKYQFFVIFFHLGLVKLIKK